MGKERVKRYDFDDAGPMGALIQDDVRRSDGRDYRLEETGVCLRAYEHLVGRAYVIGAGGIDIDPHDARRPHPDMYAKAPVTPPRHTNFQAS